MKETKVFTDVEVKEYDEKELTVTHFISTEKKDRGGDIMRADGMRITGRPVVLMSHGMSRYGQEPIAKPVWIRKSEHKGVKGILAKTKFFDDPDGRRLWAKATGGYMPNWSIGYLILKKEDFRDGDGYGRDIKEWELLEYSPVGVPMNPQATIADTEKMAQRIEVKILNDHFFKELEGNILSVRDGDGRILTVDELRREAKRDVSAWFWSIWSQK